MATRTAKFPPKTLVSLRPVQVFAATYVDGQQLSDTRMVAVLDDQVYFLHPSAKDDASLKPPAGWLKQKILEEAGTDKKVNPEDLPKDNVEIPMEAEG